MRWTAALLVPGTKGVDGIWLLFDEANVRATLDVLSEAMVHTGGWNDVSRSPGMEKCGREANYGGSLRPRCLRYRGSKFHGILESMECYTSCELSILLWGCATVKCWILLELAH